MSILLVTRELSLEDVIKEALVGSGLHPEICIVSSDHEIGNNLMFTDDIDAVFISPTILDVSDDTFFELVQKFTEAGFGVGQKYLVAIGGVNHTQRLVNAGCSHQTDLMPNNIRNLIFEIFKKTKVQCPVQDKP